MSKLQKITKCDIIPQDLSKLPPKHEQAVALIVAGKTITEAANEVGLSRQTLSRLVNQNLIAKSELARLRSEQTQNIRDRMLVTAVKAVDVIDRVLDDESIGILDRSKAALSVVGRIASLLDFSGDFPTDPRIAARMAEDIEQSTSFSVFNISEDDIDERLMKEQAALVETE